MNTPHKILNKINKITLFGKKKIKSSITIYLLLMLVLVLALICTLIESGRVSAINSRLRSVTYMAADSVFAEYAQPMFDEYGVTFLWMDEEMITSKFNKYVSENLNVDSTGIKQSLSLYGMQPVGSELKEVIWATDDSGVIFVDQVSQYMKYYLAEDIIDKSLSDIKFFSQGDKIQSFFEKVNKYKEVFLNVEKAIKQIETKVDQAKSLSQNPRLLISEISSLVDEYTVTSDNSIATQIDAKVSHLKNVKSQIENSLEEVKQTTNEYKQTVQKAKGVVKNLESELTVEKESYDEQVYEIIKSQLDEIKSKSGADATDYYNIEGNMMVTQDYINQLNDLDNFFDLTSEGINFDNLVTYKNSLAMYQQKFEDFNLNNLGINFDNIETQKESSSFIDSVDALLNGGLLSFVAGEVSSKGVDNKEFPSKVFIKEKDNKTNNEDNILSASSKKVLTSEYVIKHFGNYRNVLKDSALDYEAEYVIAGKTSDRENLEAVLGDIVLIRSGMNLISLLKDSQKKAEALSLATAIIGFTGQPVFVEIVKYIILSTWALAESITDAKALCEGKKVPTIKNANEWNVSIEGLKNFSSETINSKSYEKGLSYEDYLRLLLIMQNTRTQAYRDMDVIQANMCKREHLDFRMKDCIASMKIEASFKANQLFVAFGFISKYLDSSKGYSFKYLQEYSY